MSNQSPCESSVSTSVQLKIQEDSSLVLEDEVAFAKISRTGYGSRNSSRGPLDAPESSNIEGQDSDHTPFPASQVLSQTENVPKIGLSGDVLPLAHVSPFGGHGETLGPSTTPVTPVHHQIDLVLPSSSPASSDPSFVSSSPPIAPDSSPPTSPPPQQLKSDLAMILEDSKMIDLSYPSDGQENPNHTLLDFQSEALLSAMGYVESLPVNSESQPIAGQDMYVHEASTPSRKLSLSPEIPHHHRSKAHIRHPSPTTTLAPETDTRTFNKLFDNSSDAHLSQSFSFIESGSGTEAGNMAIPLQHLETSSLNLVSSATSNQEQPLVPSPPSTLSISLDPQHMQDCPSRDNPGLHSSPRLPSSSPLPSSSLPASPTSSQNEPSQEGPKTPSRQYHNQSSPLHSLSFPPDQSSDVYDEAHLSRSSPVRPMIMSSPGPSFSAIEDALPSSLSSPTPVLGKRSKGYIDTEETDNLQPVMPQTSKRIRVDATMSSPPPSAVHKRPTFASQKKSRKKLVTPFRSPLMSKAGSRAPSPMVIENDPQTNVEPVKSWQSYSSTVSSENENEQLADVAKDIPRLGVSTKAASQFKSPLARRTATGPRSIILPTVEIQNLERRLAVLKRAVKINRDSDEEKLEALATKWKEAGREAAYDLWSIVREMANDQGEGGQKNQGWGWGWEGKDEEGPMKEVEKLGGEEEPDKQEDTLGIMLRKLGIAPETFGWDDEQEIFVD